MMTLRTPREAIQAASDGFHAGATILEKIGTVAHKVEAWGFGERITTGMIRRQLIRSGRA